MHSQLQNGWGSDGDSSGPKPENYKCKITKKIIKTLAKAEKAPYLCTTNINGVLAHLARARHWQCRGERFESAILHKESDFRVPFSEIALVFI